MVAVMFDLFEIEIARYDWTRLRSASSTVRVPMALRDLRAARSGEAAIAAYGEIDGCVLAGGFVYESALPATACLVLALSGATYLSRKHILRLLRSIADAQPSPSELELGNDLLVVRCIEEMRRAFITISVLVDSADADELEYALDLIGLLSVQDSTLRVRAADYINALLRDSRPSWLDRELAENWLVALAAQ